MPGTCPPGWSPALEASAYFDPPNFNFPFGTHVAVVEVDDETGQVDLVRYVAVDDFGVVVNPEVVDGQTHGNIALGVGQALLEQVVFDDDGRILTDSYGTYPIPRASTLPHLETERTVHANHGQSTGREGRRRRQQPARRAGHRERDLRRPVGSGCQEHRHAGHTREGVAGDGSDEVRRDAAIIPVKFDYVAPATLDEAIGLLAGNPAAHGRRAGGQALLPAMTTRRVRPSVVVDVGRIDGLRGISVVSDRPVACASGR